MTRRGQESDLVDIEVRVNGRSLNGRSLPAAARMDLRQATVEESLDAASMFTLVFYNRMEGQMQTFWSDSDLFAPGSEVDIRLGALGDLRTVLVGEITGLEPVFAAAALPLLIVRGYDHRHRLMRGSRTASFTKMKDSAIVRQVAGRVGLSAKVTDTQVEQAYVLQHNQTDLAFLQTRAARLGYELFVRDRVLYFRPPNIKASPVTTLDVYQDMLTFSPRLTTMAQAGGVAAQGWDMMKKKPFSATARNGQEIGLMNGRTSGPRQSKRVHNAGNAQTADRVVSKSEAEAVAKGQFNQMALAHIRGEGLCYGRNTLRIGEVVDITGAGQTFSGHYYLTNVTHTITPQDGYRTHFRVQRNAT